MNSKSGFEWNVENTARLWRLWNTGVSQAEIARELGCTVNTIAGKISRMGLRTKKVEKKKTPRHPPKISVREEKLLPRQQEHYAGAALMDLSEKQCRWPIGETHAPDFKFCGQPVEKKPYCPHHRARSLQRQRQTSRKENGQ